MSDNNDIFIWALVALAAVAFCFFMYVENCHKQDCLEWKSTERTICTGNEWQKICEPEKICVRWRTP